MKDYFFGYYYKCQSETQMIALIAAAHGAGKNRSCSMVKHMPRAAMDIFHKFPVDCPGDNMYY